MTKKILFTIFSFSLIFTKISAEDISWIPFDLKSSTDSSFVAMDIAQDQDYALAAWVEQNQSTSTYDLFYAYFNGSDWTIENTAYVSKSASIENVKVAISTINDLTVPLISYTINAASENSNSGFFIDYFTINSDKTWTINKGYENTTMLDSYFFNFKGNSCVVIGNDTDNYVQIFVNNNVSDLNNFENNFIANTTLTIRNNIYNTYMPNEKYVFFITLEYTINVDTEKRNTTISLHKLNTQNSEISTHTKTMENQEITAVAVTANDADECTGKLQEKI